MTFNNSANLQVIQYNTLTAGANNLINNVSPGSSGQILTSNGPAAQPTYQFAPNGVISYVSCTSGNPLDSQTYYFAAAQAFTNNTLGNASTRFYIPKACTLKYCYGVVQVLGVLGSSENCIVALRLNSSSNINIVTNLQLTVIENVFGNNSLSTALSAGDYLEFIFICPSWVTNPTTVRFSATFFAS